MLYQNQFYTDTLPAGSALSITSTGTGLVTFTSPGQITKQVSISSSTTLGPFQYDQLYRVSCLSGTINLTEVLSDAANLVATLATDSGNNVTGLVGPGGASVMTIRNGQVANRCGFSSSVYAGYKQCMNRSAHRATENLTLVKLVFGNWGMNGGTEQANDAAATIECSIEYPVDTYTRVTFSSANIGNMASGANITSDAVKVSIPKGAVFYVRNLVTSPNTTTGLYGTDNTYLHSSGAGSYLEGQKWNASYPGTDYSVSGNLVMTKGTGGTSGNNDGFNALHPLYRPLAIIAQTVNPSVLIAGDSIAMGAKDGVDTQLAAGFYERALKVGTINVARSGEQIIALMGGSNFTRRAALYQYCSHVIVAFGTNDVFVASAAAATIITNINTLISTYFANFPVYVSTVIPQVTTSDAYITEANQTVKAQESVRLTLNNSIRAGGVVGAVGVFDIDQIISNSYTGGKFKTFGTGATLTTDGVHPNQLGNGYTAAQLNVSLIR